MGQTNEKLDNGFIPHDHLSVLSATNANEESTTVLEAPLMPHIFPNKILSCRIVLFQESALKGNALLYDSSKDPNIRKAYATLRAKTEKHKKQQSDAEHIQHAQRPTGTPVLPTASPTVNSPISSSPKVTQKPPQQKRMGQGGNKMGVNDINLLGEMIFGAIPMQIKGQNTKVHFLPQYRQTLLTKLFQVSIPSSWISFDEDQDIPHRPRRISHDDFKTSSMTDLHAAVPITNSRTKSVVLASTPDLSTMITTHHAFRRRSLSMSESNSSLFDVALGSNAFSDDDSITVSSIPMHSTLSDSSVNIEDSPKKKKRKKKKTGQAHYLCKSLFALGVVFVFHDDDTNDKDFLQQASQLQKLIFSHFAIIEHRMRRLLKACSAAIKSYLKQAIHQTQQVGKLSSIFQGSTFNIRLLEHSIQTDADVSKATKEFQRFIISFFHAPRLERPLWLTKSISPPQEHPHIISTFMNQLVEIADREGFISSLFTAVLTHHLTWTTRYSKKNTEENECASMLLTRALCSVYGAGYWQPRKKLPPLRSAMMSPVPSPHNGKSPMTSPRESPAPSPHASPRGDQSPMNSPRGSTIEDRLVLKKFCRVIAVGDNLTRVRQLLYVLSYMLRAGDVVEHDYNIIDSQVGVNTPNNLPETPLTAPSGVSINAMFEESNSTPQKPPLSRSRTSTDLGTDVHVSSFKRASLTPFRFIQMGNTEVQKQEKIEPYQQHENDAIIPPPTFTKINQDQTRAKNRFGHALYGDMGTWYCGAMVLMGLPKSVDFIEEAVSDLKLMQTERMDGDDETPDVSCLIVADSDDMLVNVFSSSKQHGIKIEEARTSKHVHETLMNLVAMKSLFDDETCEAYLDDRLRELYSKAETLVCIVDDLTERRLRDMYQAQAEEQQFESGVPSMSSLLKRSKPVPQLHIDPPKPIVSPTSVDVAKLTYREVAASLDVTVSDIPLLLSIVSTFRADILNVVCKTRSREPRLT